MSLCAVGEDLREEPGWPLDVEDIEASAFGIVHSGCSWTTSSSGKASRISVADDAMT